MKKKLVFFAIIFVLIVLILLFAHYAPVWVSITNLVSFFVGAVIGWFVNLTYNRFVK